ncbi:cysteine proteinase [Dothidotthia symphoricarpi CBS 119687]|uniref:Ubiquitin carboxyl-terminal hydrolase n=1 Tax=Dothidotthia symphoricarpi CBS 119687 TaxID=1392245 RepID=A0A6A6APD8_9PLEO|nr:cysteine proteinase [Dothidotthia symphoricarpi CBS 119687]KAF2132804.1 cysteine proteinase [Dothidotthia symphoricarpi CBS 119687]
MTSFFGRLKSGAAPATPASGSTPVKKDPNAPEPTPLEKLLLNAGPLRGDGSDKFFGFENFGSTCYCNSVVQCLYYSVPFREQVINFPARSPPEALHRPQLPLRVNTNLANGPPAPLSPPGRTSVSSPTARTPGKPAPAPAAANGPAANKPEDNKDSPEYKKKQALAAGPVLTMDYENANAYGMSESLFSSLKDIFEAVIAHQSRMGVVSPHKFLEILRRDNEMFRTPMHQDAHEFLNLLLNEVVENVETFSKARITELGDADAGDQALTTTDSNNKNTGWVHRLFEGTLTSETRCLTCENTSQRDEVFLDLSVDLEQHSSVTSCLRKFSQEEMLCERNKFHCDNCGGLQEAEKRMKIKRLPKILALHLKRFKYTEDLQRLQKLFHRVVYPYYLRLFNTTDDAEDPDRLYELYAVVVHIGGGPYHGHYVSIIKTPDRGWLLFDDEMVEPVDKAYVRNFFGGENVLACAYVLFYQETTEEAMMKEQEAEALAAAKQATETNQEAITVTTPKPTNGYIHPLHGATTPLVEESDQFASLNHAATAPSLVYGSTEHHPVEHVSTNIPNLTPKKSNMGLFKNLKEDKERKAEAKELERQAKQKRKEMDIQRRENYKRQEDELRAALAASKQSKADDDRKRANGEDHASTSTGTSAEPQKDPNGAAHAGANTNTHANGMSASLGKSSGLSRFRHTSISLKGKPKFWSANKEKEKDVAAPAVAVPPPEEVVRVEEDKEKDKDKEKEKEKEKEPKNRFSIGRKKSTFKF